MSPELSSGAMDKAFLLEYEVRGEQSQVSMDDALIIIEELQASAADFETFLSSSPSGSRADGELEDVKTEMSDTERADAERELLQCRTEEDFRRFLWLLL